MAVASAFLLKSGVDAFLGSGSHTPFGGLLLAVGMLVAAILVGALLRYRSFVDAERLGQSYVHDVRVKLFRHVLRNGSSREGRKSNGALLLRFAGDLTALRNWASLGLGHLIVSGTAIALSLAALALIDRTVAASITVSLAAAIAVSLLLGPQLQRQTLAARNQRGRLAALINDRIGRIGVIEAFGQERRETRRLAALSTQLSQLLVERARPAGALRAIAEATGGLATVIALLAGGLQVSGGMASAGSVVAAMAVAGILASRLQDLGRVNEYWNAAVVAREKQLELLRVRTHSRKQRKHQREALRLGKGRLELKDVAMSPLFSHLNLRVAPGERVGIIGANGAGKSTLLQIAAGLTGIDSGTVLLDGQDIALVKRSHLRTAFALVSDDVRLLRGSLKLNLTYGARHVTDDDLVAMVRKCGLEGLVTRLGGLATRLAEDAAGLSSSEKAQLGLARALLIQPRVLLLDEADGYLDDLARARMNRALADFQGTVIFATRDSVERPSWNKTYRLVGGHLESGVTFTPLSVDSPAPG
jgi:ABC-type multidrug transport system fused ATPase/permease subunit